MKKEHKIFLLPEFMEEEKYLEEQHKLGWKFVEIKGISKYIFEATENEDYIYQLDIIPAEEDEEMYIQMLKDYGWEFVTIFNSWYYFRRKRNDSKGDIQIYSDSNSKLDMIKRSLKIQISALLLLTILTVTIVPYAMTSLEVGSPSTIIKISFIIIYGFLWILSIRNMFKFKKLEKDIANPVNDDK